MPLADKVPMMFRAQIGGRCQLQYLDQNADKSDAQIWISEWLERAYGQSYTWHEQEQLQTHTCQFDWRLVTNGGQDDGIIRPVIGAYGLPFYPGSSMKGAFRDACTDEQAKRYCGCELPGRDFAPGILRFHGGYPTDEHWQKQLLDLVHPQQDWQVKVNNTNRKPGGAFAVISLYQPELCFAISSLAPLPDSEWQTIWDIWQRALGHGLGCRVSAGYGQPKELPGKPLYRCFLTGQGQASLTIDGQPEFRPSMFRAALRGHALRIFGGLTDAATAEAAVEQLFGGVSGTGTVGLLVTNWRSEELNIGKLKSGYREATYDVTGSLRWFLRGDLSPEVEKALRRLLAQLTGFAVLLGGFGKSWRRADHRLFYPQYYDGGRKPLIGCHWGWQGASLNRDARSFQKLDRVGDFIDRLRETARDWLRSQDLPLHEAQPADWRESWHPGRVQVWGRVAADDEDSEAISWFHEPYQSGDTIARTSLTGKVSQIGRIWHRLYPFVLVKKVQSEPKPKFKGTPTNRFWELLTIFPDDSQQARDFLDYLETVQPGGFQRLWGGE